MLAKITLPISQSRPSNQSQKLCFDSTTVSRFHKCIPRCTDRQSIPTVQQISHISESHIKDPGQSSSNCKRLCSTAGTCQLASV